MAVCAVMAGASSFAAISDWLQDLDEHSRIRLGFTDALPAGTTVWRLLIRLDAPLLSGVLAGWLRTRTSPPNPATDTRRHRRVIAVDGKTLRGARRDDGRQVHLLSALTPAPESSWPRSPSTRKAMRSRRSRRYSTASNRSWAA
ncbi:transposase family protein [Catenuloplanes indicus]|uniref:H repeat-associated protein N-terminal domain-containing protein n=1 Tax=Catenuloplanes indicus TaxID=137267 RepID=A0AAE3VVG2_9ACTN|nr:transposase family protein [Catenuloplanes indicus]MDQ0364481.1 hypothetical protein [Catenuloplanes indicus]